jgi:hypothetical protein
MVRWSLALVIVFLKALIIINEKVWYWERLKRERAGNFQSMPSLERQQVHYQLSGFFKFRYNMSFLQILSSGDSAKLILRSVIYCTQCNVRYYNIPRSRQICMTWDI